MANDSIAWHFTGATLRDGSPIPAIGETLVYEGKIELCKSGYHWSPKPHQALEYAPGNLLHMVRYGGVIDKYEDKGVSSERTILATTDAEHLLRRFAADQALSVAHLWDMPEVVREYLTTLDENTRIAAWVVAGSVTGFAPNAAAWAATRSSPPSAVAKVVVRTAARATTSAADGFIAWAAAWAEFNRRVYAAFGVSDHGE